ncbi:uncharacterized protein PADG_00703 [Paracoccidioides brasiliensis Pb18]|uniref:Uncharacterized protein n=1 Tax=Paracoccidioides brasiliensis (strain Pb18) TaxID=502780 RepID=C1G1G3_PARBD|nr:uncharacterized protein PADG_00703 [Paracoccidioides brasiliensis Pb18]EEH44414.2 hypothetical protein PADG_00703 [Paracoccidioides brasiliensis Pb18]
MAGQSAAAQPILASALLSAALRNSHVHGLQHLESGEREPWDLIRDIEEGVSLLPAQSILSCGRVIGISGLQSMGARAPREGMDDDIRSWVDEVSQHILVTLLSKYTPGLSLPRAFLIQYFDSRPLTSQSIYPSIQQRLPDHSAEEIESILGNLQTHRVYDFDELLQAVSQVSDTLFEFNQLHRGLENKETECSSTQILLLIEGIDQSLEETIRFSNPGAAQARLIPLLRTLTVLSRTYASFLSVILVNSISLPYIPSIDLARERVSTDGNDTNAWKRQHRQHSQQLDLQQQQQHHLNVPVHSIFAKIPERTNHHSKKIALSTYLSPLARSLDQGCDVHLLVSRVEGQMVIEVAKDRAAYRPSAYGHFKSDPRWFEPFSKIQNIFNFLISLFQRMGIAINSQ